MMMMMMILVDMNRIISYDSTQQDTNYSATCLLSPKLYKLDEPDTQDTAGEARTSS